MLLTVLILGGSILGASAIAGYLMTLKIRNSSDIINSTKAIYAADAGIEWKLYNLFKNSYPKPVFFNGVQFEIIPDAKGFKSVGSTFNKDIFRAFWTESCFSDGVECSEHSDCCSGYCADGVCGSFEEMCGNDVCDFDLGESYDTCPDDCCMYSLDSPQTEWMASLDDGFIRVYFEGSLIYSEEYDPALIEIPGYKRGELRREEPYESYGVCNN